LLDSPKMKIPQTKDTCSKIVLMQHCLTVQKWRFHRPKTRAPKSFWCNIVWQSKNEDSTDPKTLAPKLFWYNIAWLSKNEDSTDQRHVLQNPIYESCIWERPLKASLTASVGTNSNRSVFSAVLFHITTHSIF
jgi:hypothetical protein